MEYLEGVRTKIKCNKCGKIMPLVWAGTMKGLQKKGLQHKVELIRKGHKCKKLNDITLIEEIL